MSTPEPTAIKMAVDAALAEQLKNYPTRYEVDNMILRRLDEYDERLQGRLNMLKTDIFGQIKESVEGLRGDLQTRYDAARDDRERISEHYAALSRQVQASTTSLTITQQNLIAFQREIQGDGLPGGRPSLYQIMDRMDRKLDTMAADVDHLKQKEAWRTGIEERAKKIAGFLFGTWTRRIVFLLATAIGVAIANWLGQPDVAAAILETLRTGVQ